MIGMGTQWQKREVAERLIRSAGDLVEGWDDPDIDTTSVREWVTQWLGSLPGTYWDLRIGPKPEGRQ